MNRRFPFGLAAPALALALFVLLVERRHGDTHERAERARRVFDVRADEVDYLRLTGEGLRIECVRVADGWEWMSPARGRADTTRIQPLLDAIETLPRERMLTADEQRRDGLAAADFGLDRPRLEITLGRGGLRRTLQIGQTSAGGLLYTRFGDAEDVLCTATGWLARLPRRAADWRDHRIFPAQPVTRIELRRPEGFLQLARNAAGEWQMQQPRTARADAAAVDALLERFRRLTALDFLDDRVPDPSVLGMDERAPQARLYFEGADAAGVTVTFGQSAPAPVAGRYVRVGEDLYGVVATDALDFMRVAPDTLYDPRLLPFAPEQIGAVRLRDAEVTLELRATSGGVWRVSAPYEAEADGEAVLGLLRRWTGLRGEPMSGGGTAAEASPDPFATAGAARCEAHFLPSLPAPNGTESWSNAWMFDLSGPLENGGNWLARRRTDGVRFSLPPASFTSDLPLQPWRYRTRRVAQLAPEDVRGLRWKSGGQTWRWERPTTPASVEAAPAAGADTPTNAPPPAASARLVDVTLLALRPLTAVRWAPGDEATLAAAGLDTASMQITIELAADKGLSKILLLGRRATDGVWAMIRGQDAPFVMLPGLADALAAEAERGATAPAPSAGAAVPTPR